MNRTVSIAALIYSMSILLSRVIGLIRESVIGRVLGDQPEADVYWIAFILPDFLNYLLAGGALSLVLIPLLQAAQARGGQDERWLTFSRINTPVTLFTLGLTGLLWLLIPRLTPLISPGFDPEQLTLLNRLTRIILPAQIFHICGGLISATLQAEDRHLAPAIAPLLYTGFIILGGLSLGSTMGAEGFAWGVLCGSFVGPFLCPLIAARAMGMRWKWTWSLGHDDVKRYLWRALPVMLGFSIVVLDELIVKRLATAMSAGVVSQLHYARVLMKVPMGVFGLALGMAAFPTLSRLIAQREEERALDLLQRSAEALFILVGLAQVALTLSAGHLATLIWGTERISLEGLQAINVYCALFSLGLWAWSLQGLIARGFYAQGKTWMPTLLGSIVVLIFLPLYQIGSGWGERVWSITGLAINLKGEGIGLACVSSGAISLYVIILWLALCHSSRQARFRWLISWIGRVFLAFSLSVCLVDYLLPTSLGPSSSPFELLYAVSTRAGLGLSIFLIVMLFIGRAPLDALFSSLKKRLG